MAQVTIEDVAKAAGVSTFTVSRALRGMDHVAPRTREKVIASRERAELHRFKGGVRIGQRADQPCRIAVPRPHRRLVHGRVAGRPIRRIQSRTL